MTELLLVDKKDLKELVADEVKAAYQRGYEDANDHYVSIKQAADIMNTSIKNVYRDFNNNKFIHILENPSRILKSEILQKK